MIRCQVIGHERLADSRDVSQSIPETLTAIGNGLRCVLMELVAGPPSRWIVTLVGGSQVEVWADSVTGLTEKTAHHEHVEFGVLMDIDADLQDQFEITARGRAGGSRVVVAVARFPRSCVLDVVTAA